MAATRDLAADHEEQEARQLAGAAERFAAPVLPRALRYTIPGAARRGGGPVVLLAGLFLLLTFARLGAHCVIVDTYDRI